MKQNCWETMRCGRQPGGAKAGELGICPASTAAALNGVHGGTNGGRACWVVAGTICGDQVRGTFAKTQMCSKCRFYLQVVQEEGPNLISFSELRAMLQHE